MFLGLLALVKLLDMGFFVTLGRPFNPVTDWSYFGSALGLLSDSIGRPGAVVFLALAAVVGVAVLVFMPLSLARLARLVGRHRATSIRVVTALGVVWTLCAGFGVQLAPDAPIAATSAARFVSDEVSQVGAGIQDQQTFARALAVDPLRDTAGDELLSGLHGKDVIVAFVESYGRVAVQDSVFSTDVGTALDAGTRPAACGRIFPAKRFSHLSDLWRRKLAGPLHTAIRPVDR